MRQALSHKLRAIVSCQQERHQSFVSAKANSIAEKKFMLFLILFIFLFLACIRVSVSSQKFTSQI